MNLDYIRNKVHSYQNIDLSFVYHGGRGQDEYFSGKIVNMYSRIFLILDKNGRLYSFSYSDFLIKTLKIIL